MKPGQERTSRINALKTEIQERKEVEEEELVKEALQTFNFEITKDKVLEYIETLKDAGLVEKDGSKLVAK